MITKPTLYRPEHCEKLIEHMSQGLSFESFSGVLSCSKKTIYDWAERHPEFAHAKEIGFNKCLLLWEKIGINGATGKIKNFNCATYIFNMKNRFKWRDRSPEEIAESQVPFLFAYEVKKKEIAESIDMVKE